MRKNSAALATAALLAACSPASAQLVDGQHLQKICSQGQPQEQQAACVGFISGALDATQRTHQFCIPAISPQEVMDRTISYLRAKAREIGGLPGDQQVMLALKANWPCTQGAQLQIPPALAPAITQLAPYMAQALSAAHDPRVIPDWVRRCPLCPPIREMRVLKAH
jgi:hypothetical protein